MKLLLAVLPYLAIQTDASCHQHNAVFKSVLTTDRECNIYLQDGTCAGEDCSARCRGLLTRYWNDTVGVPSATINRFYKPNILDLDHDERTECCLKEVILTVPKADVCHRADATIGCFNRHYGNFKVKSPKFVPFTELQHERILQECIDILQIPDYIVTGYLKDGIEHYPEAKCLLRCLLIREGLYTDVGGPDLHKMSVQCDGSYSDEESRKKAVRCVKKLQKQCVDKCELAFRICDECIVGDYQLISIFIGTSKSTSNSLTLSPSKSIDLPSKVESVFAPYKVIS